MSDKMKAVARRSDVSLFVPLFLALSALAVIAVTLPLSGVHIPGQRHLQALMDRVPQPWKPPKPVYVAPPDPADTAITAALPAVAPPPAAQSAQPAPAVAQPTAASVAAPASAAPASPAASQPVAQAAAPSAPAVTVAPAPAAIKLGNFRHQWQTWNNCGPATITMAMSHFGRPEQQAQAAQFLKPNPDDKNVSPDELVAYARSVGMMADYRLGGDLPRLKALLANEIPVVVEMWFTPHPNDGMGHYRLLVGYDDAAGRFIAYDSYDPPGINVPLPYGPFDADWRVFNRTYVPVYPPEKAPVVDAILGTDRDDQTMLQRALDVATSEATAQPNDAYAWFNIGSTLTAMGRSAEAVPAFDRARALKLPWRMLWYQFAPFQAYLDAGRYNDVLSLTGANLQQASDLEESQYYRGRALQAQGQTAPARAAYQAALKANPKYTPAYYSLSTLS